MKTENINIPPSFNALLTDEDWNEICVTSKFNADQCRRLWEHLGRTDDPPTSLTIYANRDDVLRLWPEKKT